MRQTIKVTTRVTREDSFELELDDTSEVRAVVTALRDAEPLRPLARVVGRVLPRTRRLLRGVSA